MTLSKLRQVITCGRASDSISNSRRKDKPHTQTSKGNEENGQLDCLSEVAAPYPVERVTDDELARRESLESNISKEHSQPHLSNN